MERGESEGWGLRPRPHGFVFPNPDPPCMMGKIFLLHSSPLGPVKPFPIHKTLLLVNLPTTVTIIFNKTCFVNKNILEIKNKFILSN